MKLLNGKDDPTFEIVSIMGSDGYKAIQLIERMGRISYQSQDKISKDRAIRFVNMLRRRIPVVFDDFSAIDFDSYGVQNFVQERRGE